MRELPILFNTAMVSALLDGRKVETRRPFKAHVVQKPRLFEGLWLEHHPGGPRAYKHNCPFGAVGDRLWVRETWAALQHGSYEELTGKPSLLRGAYVVHRASDRLRDDDKETRGYGYRPSIHMPKWAARIWLEVVEVRVERVQSIDGLGCLAEGIEGEAGEWNAEDWREKFAELWDSIYSSWDANGWVWVARFKVLSTDGKPGGGES